MQKISARQMRGQIGIIVILITAAILTFGLSIADRVVQENKVVVDRSDSIRVFNVAETGVDEALNQIYQYEAGLIDTIPITDLLPSDPYNQVSIASSQSFEGYFDQGDSLRIDLKANQTGTVTLEWSKTQCNSAYRVGLLLNFLHLHSDDSQYLSFHYLVAGENECLYSSSLQNFQMGNYTAANDYKYSYEFELTTGYKDPTLYIQPIGSGTNIRVSSDSDLIEKAQYEIESLAKSEDDISNKTIEVSKSLPSAPGFMSFALFSGGTITK